MSAQDTLAKVIDLEAEKLLKRSIEAKDAPLGADDLEALESLARCVRALRPSAPATKGKPEDETASVAELLAAATK